MPAYEKMSYVLAAFAIALAGLGLAFYLTEAGVFATAGTLAAAMALLICGHFMKRRHIWSLYAGIITSFALGFLLSMVIVASNMPAEDFNEAYRQYQYKLASANAMPFIVAAFVINVICFFAQAIFLKRNKRAMRGY